MAGTWDPKDKPKLPGWYNRFKFQAQKTLKEGTKGVFTMPIKADWGPVKQVIKVSNEIEFSEIFGYNEDLLGYKLASLAFLGSPKAILFYRITNGNEATGKYEIKDSEENTVITLETKYPTERNFNITIRENIGSSDKKDIILYENQKVIEKFEALSINTTEITSTINSNSEYLIATEKTSGNGTINDVLNQKFVGGNNGIDDVDISCYLDYLKELDKHSFNKMSLDGVSDEGLNVTIKSWVDQNINKGKCITAFIGYSDEIENDEINQKSKSLNHEGIVNVNVKGYLNGKWYSRAECACYFGALSTGLKIQDSLCNSKVIFEDIEILTDDELKEAQDLGTLVCYKDHEDEILILDDVNTLSKDSDKGEYLRYIRVVDFRNTVDADLNANSKRWIGKIPNDGLGKNAILSAMKNYFEPFVNERIIEADFTVDIDEELQQNAKKDEFFWKWSATHIDVVKKVYSTGYIK